MSERYEEYYARQTSIKPDLAFIRRQGYDRLLASPPGQYTLIKRTDDSPAMSHNDCRQISQFVGEAIYVAVQENVGSFHYEHWKEGTQLRLLSFNSDYSWHKVLGEPEAWEEHALFTDDILKRNLGCYDDSHDQIKKAWQTRHIKEGDRFPAIHECEAYRGVVSFLKNPAETK